MHTHFLKRQGHWGSLKSRLPGLPTSLTGLVITVLPWPVGPARPPSLVHQSPAMTPAGNPPQPSSPHTPRTLREEKLKHFTLSLSEGRQYQPSKRPCITQLPLGRLLHRKHSLTLPPPFQESPWALCPTLRDPGSLITPSRACPRSPPSPASRSAPALWPLGTPALTSKRIC